MSEMHAGGYADYSEGEEVRSSNSPPASSASHGYGEWESPWAHRHVRETAQWDARWSHPIPHDNLYYAKCVIGGVLSSSIRWIKTPLDSVKCNMQVNPARYDGMASGLRILWAEAGMAGLFKGLGPTVLSYGFQSGTKYGLYEVFKDRFSTAVGEDNAHKYRGLVYVTAAGCAEGIADILMCPWEMLKVKVQTSPPGTFPRSLGPALSAAIRQRTELRFPFGSILPLWGRQLPGTIANFYTFEKVAEGFYTYIFTKPKESYDKSTQLGITFASGYVAGFVSTVISHPADSLVSLMGKPENKGKSMAQIARETGFVRLATQGIVPRVFMTGSTIGFQWIIYDAFKTAMGMGTTGGDTVDH